MTVVETTRLTVRMPKSLREELEKIGRKDDRDASYVARQALRQYVAVHKVEDGAA